MFSALFSRRLFRSVLYGLLAVELASCAAESDFRPCPTTHTDPRKVLYNDILTQVIEQQLSYHFLPDEDLAVIRRHYQDRDLASSMTAADSVWQRRQEVRFQRHLFQDTARFRTFYLNRSQGAAVAHLPDNLADHQPGSPLDALLRAFAPQDLETAIALLNCPQANMEAADFQLCTARLLPMSRRTRSWIDEQGMLTLSEPYFNAARDQALMAYGWQCGGTCGHGAVLWVERVQGGHWRIKQAHQTWIS